MVTGHEPSCRTDVGRNQWEAPHPLATADLQVLAASGGPRPLTLCLLSPASHLPAEQDPCGVVRLAPWNLPRG